MKMKLVSIAMLVCLVATLLAGCGNNGGSTGTTAANSAETTTEATDNSASTGTSGAATYTKAGGDGEVVIGIAADPENLGPWAGMSQGRIAVLYSIYEYLVTLDGGKAYGVLAKNWTQVDGKTYDVELYDNIHDTAGNKLTASDIVFSFETAIATNNYGKLATVAGVKKIDDYNVEFTFTKDLEIGEFENIMMECAIVTQKAYEASSDQMATDPVGTTAYAVTSYVPGSTLVMEDTGNYWQTDATFVHSTSLHNNKKLTFSVITEASQMTVALQTHSIDISNGIPDTDVDKFNDGGEYADGNSVAMVYDNLSYDIEYNMSSQSVFQNDLNLRMAIAYAIDKDGINQGAFNGNGKVVKDFANANYPDYISDWDSADYFNYDAEKAKQYLKDSSYNGETLTIMYNSSAAMDTIAQMLQAYLSQIGITAELTGYDASMFQSAQYDAAAYDIMLKNNGSTDYIVNQWKLCWDARDYKSVTGGTANYVVDDQLQTLMEAALNVNTYGDSSIKAFHDYLVQQCYGYGLVQGTINIVHSDYITDVALDARNQILPGACTFAQ
jgi:ABC-type transport system substrate-binding protein